jgi:rubredoxin
MDTYICTMCGHVYDPAKGEQKQFAQVLSGVGEARGPEKGGTGPYVRPGTDFSALPGDWKCPICGYPKAYYRKQVPERLASLRTLA